MDFLKDINEEVILICEDAVKEKILSFNRLIPIKMMNILEFMKLYLFSYDDEAVIIIEIIMKKIRILLFMTLFLLFLLDIIFFSFRDRF